MKKLLLLILLFSTFLATSQTKDKGPFFNTNLHLTFALNENYVLFEPDDGENMLDFSAVFIRTGFGYRFNKRIESSINFGLDFHLRFRIQAIPSYLNVQYNLIANEDFKFFVNGSYGNLWKPSSNFEKGKYHAFGIGFQGNDSESKTNLTFRLDFHRKRIANFKDGNLDSVSLGFGINLF
ncbi:hypothetical protein KCTC32516_01039 [Polaribacter huanghezhanensis]|uniref:hypothetical protein n=1 Tax=Polaribacter huanghezhanensis TaxID=1354726 RepID=UPI002647F2D1|nr:hypothetical protein [Polaribacter huanghezhanensis]WKD85694.1 hypothetical protein KCTC32516_01039 [Polaribacter huanghezhanensis]